MHPIPPRHRRSRPRHIPRQHAIYGLPASTLTDNGLVYTARFRKGRNIFEHELRRLSIIQKNGQPNHPQTQGKVERFQQTMKKALAKNPPAATLDQLQAQLDAFREYYNTRRPHRSHHHNQTPTAAYAARSKATPTADDSGREHRRIRRDIVDKDGRVTLRHDGKMHHIGIRRTHARTPVLMLIQDLDIHIINSTTGEILRQFTLDPSRDYQPQNKESPETRHSFERSPWPKPFWIWLGTTLKLHGDSTRPCRC